MPREKLLAPSDFNQVGDVSHSAPYTAYLRRLKRNKLLVLFCQFALILLFLTLWEIAPRLQWVNPLLTSYPSAFLSTLLALVSDGTLLTHTAATLKATVIGFVGGMTIGTCVAIALWLSSTLYRIVDPFIVVINALPKIALVPIFYIWLGDTMSIYAMAISVSVFITILMLYTGFQSIEADKIKLVQLFGATRAQTLRVIVLPGSVPTMIATLKVNIGLTLIGVIVGEFQAAKAGLGYLIVYGSQVFQMDLVMASIFVLALISTLLFVGIQLLENYVSRRQ